MPTDDIVTRLRESHGQGCTCGAWNYSECGCSEAVWAEMFITEAADEIERLQQATTRVEELERRVEDLEYRLKLVEWDMSPDYD